MHAVVMDSLEDYLAGVLGPADRKDIETHLSMCEACREEVVGMRQVSRWVRSLRTDQALAPAAGFYSRVMQEVGHRKPVPTFSGMFSLDVVFGRRLAFGCLLVLAVLGSYLITRETGEPAFLSPEVIMAEQDAPTFDAGQAHEAMLATLTSYEP